MSFTSKNDDIRAAENSLNDDVRCLHFSPDAQPLVDAFIEQRNESAANSDLDPAVESHLIKGNAAMAALALAFQLVDWAYARKLGSEIMIGPTRLAIDWMKFLEAHMTTIYTINRDTALKAAHALAEKISEGKIRNGCTLRAIHRAGWTHLGSKEAVLSGLDFLQDCGWVRILEERNGQGRPSQILLLHPDFSTHH